MLGGDRVVDPDKAALSSVRAKAVNPPKSDAPAKDRVAVDITPGLDPMAQVRYMEVMIGQNRQFMLFTGPGNSPVVAAKDDGSAKAGAGGRAGGRRRREQAIGG